MLTKQYAGIYLECEYSGLSNRLRGWAAYQALATCKSIDFKIRWTPNWAFDGSPVDIFHEDLAHQIEPWSEDAAPNNYLYVCAKTTPKCGADPTEVYESFACGISYDHFHSEVNKFLRALRPAQEIEQRILAMRAEYDFDRVIGLHLRGTDHVEWRVRHGYQLVTIGESCGRAILEMKESGFDGIFLASDDPNIYDSAVEILGEFLVNKERPSFSLGTGLRLSSARQSALDLFLLAQCRKLLGTHGSSFSWIASKISGIDWLPVH